MTGGEHNGKHVLAILASVISALAGGAGGSITTLHLQGNRIVALEVRMDHVCDRLERMERKLDKLVERP